MVAVLVPLELTVLVTPRAASTRSSVMSQRTSAPLPPCAGRAAAEQIAEAPSPKISPKAWKMSVDVVEMGRTAAGPSTPAWP